MVDKFKAIVIDQKGENFKREIKELNLDFLDKGEVLIKVDFSDLNYKDALILNNGGKIVKDFPIIPGIDLSGKVLESSSEDFKKDDEIIVTGCRVGEIYHGGYSQIAKINKDLIIKKPNNLSLKQSMILGTAGFTALLCAFAVNAREEILLGEKVNDVLVTGATGGVGTVAVMALSKIGYNVTAITGKPNQESMLKKLGAKNVISRAEFEGEPKLLSKGLWDGVVDTVGANILSNVISQTKPNGIVAACGNAGGIKLNTSVMPFIIRGVKLWGIDSVMISKKRREFIWSQVADLIDFKLLEENIKIVNLEELLNTFPEMLSSKISGRVIVDLNT